MYGTATRQRARATSITLAGLGALLLSCTSSAPNPTGPGGQVAATVDMTSQLRFDPATVTIHVGQAVRWHNAASFVHTATDDPAKAANAADAQLPSGAQAFDSGQLTGGSEYVHTFTVAGEYHYFCKPHETLGMLGTVIVQP